MSFHRDMVPPALSVAPRAKTHWKHLVMASAVGLAIAGLTNGCAATTCSETLTCLDSPGQAPSGKDSALGPDDAGIDAGNTLDALTFDEAAPGATAGDATGDDAPTADGVADAFASDAPTPDVQTDASDGSDAQPTCPGANLMTDPGNCGTCNNACGANSVCSGGVCTAGPSIRCANSAPGCAAGTQECCLATNSTLSCVPIGMSTCSGTRIVCDDKADCPGQVCCIELDQYNNNLIGTGCFASCPSNGRRSTWLELCAIGAATCAAGTCRPLTNVTPSPPFSSGWFSACR